MGKYEGLDLNRELQDPEMKSDYTKVLIAIANELAEANTLKKIELELRIIQMQGEDPELRASLAKEDANVFMQRLEGLTE